ncbi:MAG: acyl-CoA thioesterase [Clostridiales bacterium]|jgi:acyl-CoA hydrolase|nr:acyl-CoA thioesterase [Clostridiales bacterium]
MAYKKISDSKTEQVHILMQKDINGYDRLFGGRLMEWIDIVAAVAARRHSNSEVTTVSVDSLHFKAPAYVNDTLAMSGRITYVGNSSMEVRVDTYVERLSGKREHINTAYVVLVAIDKEGKSVTVPRVMLESEEEREEWERGKKRYELRKERARKMY